MDSHNHLCLDCSNFLAFNSTLIPIYSILSIIILISEPSLQTCMTTTCVFLDGAPPVCLFLICVTLVESGLNPKLNLEYLYTPL